MGRPNPICVSCARSMRCKKNDFPVKSEKSKKWSGQGYLATIWFGDQFECPDCGIRIVIGFGSGSTENHEDLLEKALEFKR